MPNLVNGSMLAITPQLAESILELNNFAGQRRLSESKVARYADHMLNGEWIDGRQIAFAQLPDGKRYLVDGQNRLTAAARVKVPVVFSILIIPCADEDAVGELYASFDMPGKTGVRSDAERLLAVIANQPWKPENMVLAAAVLRTIAGGFLQDGRPGKILSPAKMLLLFERFKTGLFRMEDILTQAHGNSLLKRAPVAAVAAYALQVSPRGGAGFWRQIAYQADVELNGPAYLAIQKLLGYPAKETRAAVKADQSAYLASAWNAFTRGVEKMDRLMKPRKFRILPCEK